MTDKSDKMAEQIAEKVAEKMTTVLPSDAANIAASEAKIAEAKIAEAKVVAEAKLLSESEQRKENRTMWVGVYLPMFLALPSIIAAFASIVSIWRVGEYHHEVNSRMTEMIQEVRKSSYENGVIVGKSQKIIEE